MMWWVRLRSARTEERFRARRRFPQRRFLQVPMLVIRTRPVADRVVTPTIGVHSQVGR